MPNAKHKHGDDIGKEHQNVEAAVHTEEGPSQVSEDFAVSLLRQGLWRIEDAQLFWHEGGG